ncbi:MAG: hypothetical protein ACKVIY_13370 [Acidimicrobiales bacterium]
MTPKAEVRRLGGPLTALGLTVVWAFLAARAPDVTYHFAPMLIGGAWVAIDGLSRAGSTPRRAVNQAFIGFGLAIITTSILSVKGDLEGSVLWDSSDNAPVVIESLVLAALGALMGLVVAVRHAAKTPSIE